MNLLFDFLKYLPREHKEKLRSLTPTGVAGKVWQHIWQQAESGTWNKAALLAALRISVEHLDKATSELLSKSYKQLFGADRNALMLFLSTYPTYRRHFYLELNRQINRLEKEGDVELRKSFYRQCMELVQLKMPIAHTDEKVVARLGNKYLALFKGAEYKHASLFVECRNLYTSIQKEFAAGIIMQREALFQKLVNGLDTLPSGASEELTYEYYRTRIYFYHAISHFDTAYALAKEAVGALKKYKGESAKLRRLQLELRMAEYQYYMGQFDKAYQNFDRVFSSPINDKLPDRGYYITKFLQLCLATGRLQVAGKLLDDRRRRYAGRLVEEIIPREIISFIKYYLFTDQYDEAFKFIRLGYEKNPKGEYFQYEVELRNLETAYFFLTGRQQEAVEMCARHIKFLRFHKHGIRISSYPYFFILTKAIFHKKHGIRPFNKLEQAKYNRYQQGTYIVYGKLLQKMLEQ